jgi:prophage regulatory protein
MTLIDFGGLKEKGIDYSPQHIRRLVNAGIFPAPLKTGLGKNAKNQWVDDEIDAYVAAKIKERNDALATRKKEGSTPQAAGLGRSHNVAKGTSVQRRPASAVNLSNPASGDAPLDRFIK